MLPAIGSLGALNTGGRLGVTVDVRPADGRQLTALQLKTVDQRDALGRAAARVSGLAPLPAEASERPKATRRARATREEHAALAARLPHPPSAAAQEAIDQLRQQAADEDIAHAAAPAPTSSAAPGRAAVRLGLRRYAEAGERLPPARRLDLTS